MAGRRRAQASAVPCTSLWTPSSSSIAAASFGDRHVNPLCHSICVPASLYKNSNKSTPNKTINNNDNNFDLNLTSKNNDSDDS